MPRPPLDTDIQRAVEDKWGEDPAMTAAEVHRRLEDGHWKGYVSIRKVQDIVRDLKAKGAGRFEPVVWQPWSDHSSGAEDCAFLLKMRQVSLSLFDEVLWEHQAKWAKRLRVILEGLNPFLQLCFIREYAIREALGIRLIRDIITEDLDYIVAYQPWLSERHKREFFASEGYNLKFGLTEASGNFDFGLFIGTRLTDLHSTWSNSYAGFQYWTNDQGNIWDA